MLQERLEVQGSCSILVISDSHGNIPALTKVLKWVQEQINSNETSGSGLLTLEAAIFLGDGADDVLVASVRAGFAVPWYHVRGNGDFNFSIPDPLLLEISGISTRTILLSHGNRFGVEKDVQNIISQAQNVGADAAFFGHTHVPYYAMHDGILLLNPGSIGRPRTRKGPTFAILHSPIKGPLEANFFCLKKRGGAIIVQELELH